MPVTIRLKPYRTRRTGEGASASRPGATVFAFGLLTTACPADVAVEDTSPDVGSSAGTTVGTSTGAVSEPTTSAGPGSSSTASPTSTGASTGEPDDPNVLGSTTDGSSTGSSTTGGSSTGSSSTGGSSTGGVSTGESSTGDDSSSGSASTTGSGTTGGETTGGESSTGDASSTGGDDTGGEAELVTFDVCCEPGCSSTLLQSAAHDLVVRHGGSRFTTHDATRGLVLWDAATLAPLFRADQVDGATLVGDTLAYRRAGQLHILDALDLVELGACPAGAVHGVALDESYVWTAGPQGLEVLELDCDLRWSVAGDLGAAKTLASPDALHVYEADLGPQEVFHFDAADGSFEAQPFLGDFAGWFADVPRYWTIVGDTYRVYDLDNTALGLETGAPKYGWGTRLVGANTAWDLFGPQVVAGMQFVLFSGPAALGYKDGAWLLVRLDEDPMVATPLAVPANVGGASFGWTDGAWVLGGSKGRVVDHLQRRVTVGRIQKTHGGVGGRVAAHALGEELHLFDIDGDACTATVHPPLANTSTLLRMSGDGTLLLSNEWWGNPNNNTGGAGTRFYALPGGEKLAETNSFIKTLHILEYEVADDASAWARTWHYVGNDYAAGSFPLGTGYVSGHGNIVPKLSPDGTHVVHSDVGHVGGLNWTDQGAYVREGTELVGVFEGIPHGFIDDQHILVGRYLSPAVFVELQIVGLDGVVVQTTTLPDIREMARTGAGPILGVLHATGDAAIFDPFTGAELWTAPPDVEVVVAGPDHVVLNDGARLELVRWH